MENVVKKQICIRCSPTWGFWLEASRPNAMSRRLHLSMPLFALAEKKGVEMPAQLVRTRAESRRYRIDDDQRSLRKDSAVNISCESQWREWAHGFARSQGMTLHGMLDHATAHSASSRFPNRHRGRQNTKQCPCSPPAHRRGRIGNHRAPWEAYCPFRSSGHRQVVLPTGLVFPALLFVRKSCTLF